VQRLPFATLPRLLWPVFARGAHCSESYNVAMATGAAINLEICRVCGIDIEQPSLDLPAPALTSTYEQYALRTRVYVCSSCGHVQSPELPDAAEFYDTRLKCAMDSEEFDQITEIRDGVPRYRTDIQADVALKLVDIPEGARVLDFGAAKAATLRKIWTRRPDISPHVFDVSEDYRTSWNAWLPGEAMATYEVPRSWRGRFDVVTAHYVFEHVPDPVARLRVISELLAPGGRFYFSVPDWAANIGDLLVAEHTNHFTDVSIRRAVHEAGLAVDVLDPASLPYGFAVVCRVSEGRDKPVNSGIKASVDHSQLAASALQRAVNRIDTEFSSRHKRHSAVFGAGFYGAFLLSKMPDRSGVACCIDNNPHLWGKTLFGVPVVSPEKLPSSTETVYVGLNPARARAIVESVEALQRPGLDLVYIEM
jgi:SAM-dependent methyltransferase